MRVPITIWFIVSFLLSLTFCGRESCDSDDLNIKRYDSNMFKDN